MNFARSVQTAVHSVDLDETSGSTCHVHVGLGLRQNNYMYPSLLLVTESKARCFESQWKA